MREDLAVAGVGRLRTEDDRRALGAAENLVQECEFHLPVRLGSAQVWAEMGGPQCGRARPTIVCSGGIERPAHRVVEIVRLLDDQIDRLAFRAHEVVNPRELSLAPLGIWSRSPTPSKITALPPSLGSTSCLGLVGGMRQHLVAVL